MKRSFALLALGFLLYASGHCSYASCCTPTFRSINRSFVVGDTRWILYKGVAYQYALSTGTATVSRRNGRSDESFDIPYSPIDHSTFPSLLHFTSETTPLVAGWIKRMLVDDRNRLWAFTSHGDASMFDGVSWETFLHKSIASVRALPYYYETGLDVIMKDGIIRIATSEYVDEIDMNRLSRRTMLEINGTLHNPRFLGLDTIVSNDYDNFVLIDFVSNTIDIDSRIDSTADGDTVYQRPRILDVRMHASPINIRNTGHRADVHERRSEAIFWQYIFQSAPRSIYSTLRSLNVPMSDTVYLYGWTPARSGTFFDMVADANGTIYLAGFDGITVIPASNEDRTTQVNESSIASTSVYPNPASHHVTIELPVAPAKGTTAMIVDASGNTMYAMSIENPSTLVDLTAFPTGMYTVVLSSERKRAARSLVVQR